MADPLQPQAPQEDAVSRRYSMLKQQAKTAAAGQNQQVDEAIKRRAAANGQLNSGAYIKQQQISGDLGARRESEAVGQLSAQELAERAQMDEAATQRQFQDTQARLGEKFQSGENATQRGFQDTQARLGEKFQSGESNTQRGFLSGENALQRRFQDEQARAGESFQGGEAQKAFERQKPYLDSDQAIRYQTADLAQQQFKNDETAQLFNMGISAMQTASPDGWKNWLTEVERRFPSLARQQTPGVVPSTAIKTGQPGGR